MPEEYADLYRPAFTPDLLITALDRSADRPALHLGDVVLTGAEMRAAISRFQQALASVGVGQGSAVAMLSKNRPEVLISMGSTMVAGCRTTALNPMGSLSDHLYISTDAEIETLIFDPRHFEERAAELREQVPTLKNLFSLGPSSVGADILALSEEFTEQRLVSAPVDIEDTSSIVYTGGTTGKPKGVMGSFRSGAALNQIQMAEWQWPEQPRFLVCTPLSHAGAAFFVPTLLRGGCLYVLPHFDPALVLEAIEKHRINATMLVPTMIYMLLDHPDFDSRDLSSIETLFYGASAMSPSRLREGIERLGPVFFQFYGQSECGMTISVLRKEEHLPDDPSRLASCGRPVPWLDVRLLDDDLNEVPQGELGEICVRGPLVMKGYLNKPEETAEALRGGWLHTGDVARADKNGFMTIVDRKKDMIVTGGFNVFPREIEDVISSHPAVASVAVVGVPDTKWGEAVKACVVLRDGQSVPVEELIEKVRAAKGSVHAPKSVDFLDALPLTPLGKLDKKALRASYR
ncbi:MULTISPECIES: AMP-binding protein [Rhodococcus]|uniref:AMP-binding protein n=1 Tax=Rhodococcus TaxID=1827 RepID=UPI001E595052|nr:AMP-binding protein [Rhodococcus pyridinivorans]MCD2116129.1 AMP-binding protein [Rhodococcus pyridinivorans]MCZ4624996.1 AMP-binding protein [Rhodococcus pyridinivorans]MCZ4646485.1 AMP-binding protein [Rhodococcus pyridinivorans]MDJ0482712.1 AMP-binding protein [Rhodococcus pyridinivorans]MDV7252308.1 AMP-binding protein [Rhodococcus pyridinivorans]